MTDDLLREATQALQDESAERSARPGSSADESEGQFTRARVMASLHQGTVRRRTRLAFLLPIAACFAAGTAWGAATGKLPAVFDSLVKAVGLTSQRKPAPSHSPPLAGATQAERGQVEAPPTEADAPRAVAVPKEAPAGRATPSAPAKSLPALQAEGLVAPGGAETETSHRLAASAAFQDADGDVYRLAHEAHFTQQDFAKALRLWDAYLGAAPRGRFASEASYNRALCLVRLGRHAEAKRALEPFASGTMGYRQSEARQLLQELEAE